MESRKWMSFGEDVAEVYDDLHRGPELGAVEFLVDLAGTGPALELGIGTGRIALPLAQRGIRVDGIDNSPAMVERLRKKPGGESLSVTIGDFADVAVDRTYGLIYVVYNTLFNLVTQAEQVRCFENAAEHLADDGSFVIEAFVPTHLMDIRDDQYVHAEMISDDNVRLDLARHDSVNQLLYETHVALTDASTQLYPILTRYSWPSELDLMARIARLERHERWGTWNKEPFTDASRKHISVYRRSS